jgi:hypothetical protein
MRHKLTALWPLAFIISVALACCFGSRSEQSRDRPSGGSGSASDSSDGADGALAGSSWKGLIKCDDGDELQVNYKIAESGNLLYEYQTKSGAREVELESSGQMIRFVPPGGGVTTATLDTISSSPERITYSMTISEERASGGTLDQGSSAIQWEGKLSGSELEVEMNIRSQSTMSQPGIVVPGDESTVSCRGRLKR